MKIDYDKEKDILIYDRKLEKGSGPSIYGLKVCEAMGLSKDFISFAKNVQNNFEQMEIVELSTEKTTEKEEVQIEQPLSVEQKKEILAFKRNNPTKTLADIGMFQNTTESILKATVHDENSHPNLSSRTVP